MLLVLSYLPRCTSPAWQCFYVTCWKDSFDGEDIKIIKSFVATLTYKQLADKETERSYNARITIKIIIMMI